MRDPFIDHCLEVWCRCLVNDAEGGLGLSHRSVLGRLMDEGPAGAATRGVPVSVWHGPLEYQLVKGVLEDLPVEYRECCKAEAGYYRQAGRNQRDRAAFVGLTFGTYRNRLGVVRDRLLVA